MEPLEEFGPADEKIRTFVAEHVAPHAASIDRSESIPAVLRSELAKAGLLASGLPAEFGGQNESGSSNAAVRHGLMHEALGAASASVQGLVNVHHMAASAIARWGTPAQKRCWLPRIASGQTLAAVAITEPNVGSDAAAVETRAVRAESGYVVTGQKCWITCGQIADLFVLLAGSDDGALAFLLPRDTQGLSIEPITGLLGCRGYMVAKLHLDGCRLPGDHVLGRAPFGLSHVAATSLDAGRYNLAWGCVGMARSCLDASIAYARARRQFNASLSEFQLVQRIVSRMMTDVHAARLMCWRAGQLRDRRDPSAIKESAMAKYFASTMVNRVAHDAVQIHGANGCGAEYPVERYLRDARIMEIIEGSTQILEIAIARYGFQEQP
jgi:glutaryl-CoA dehydrogenase (non-decarboxylating)